MTGSIYGYVRVSTREQNEDRQLKSNAFDIEKYRSHKLVVKPTQTFDLYDMGEVEAE